MEVHEHELPAEVPADVRRVADYREADEGSRWALQRDERIRRVTPRDVNDGRSFAIGETGRNEIEHAGPADSVVESVNARAELSRRTAVVWAKPVPVTSAVAMIATSARNCMVV